MELRTRKREMRGDWANHREKLGLTQFRLKLNLPLPIQQVQVLIQRVITPIQGPQNSIMHVEPLISLVYSYPP